MKRRLLPAACNAINVKTKNGAGRAQDKQAGKRVAAVVTEFKTKAAAIEKTKKGREKRIMNGEISKDMNDRDETLFVTFRSEDDIISFVNTCNKYDDAIDIKMDKRITDAKSILGMLKMPIGQPLEIVYGCYDDEDNYPEYKEDILKNFQVEARGK